MLVYFIIHNYLFSNENTHITTATKNYLTGIKHIKNNLTVNKINKVPYTQDTTQSLHNVTLQLSRGPLKVAQELLKSKRTLHTETISHFVQKHSSTKWVTLKKVSAQLLDQNANLCEYFSNLCRQLQVSRKQSPILPDTKEFQKHLKVRRLYLILGSLHLWLMIFRYFWKHFS